MHGQRLPSTRTCVGRYRQRQQRAAHRQHRGLEDVEAVDLVAIRPADRPGERACADDAAPGARARAAREDLRVRQSADAPARDRGSRRRPPPGRRAARGRPHRRRRRGRGYTPGARASALAPRRQGGRSSAENRARAARAAPPQAQRAVDGGEFLAAVQRTWSRLLELLKQGVAERGAAAPAPGGTPAPGAARRAGSAAKSIAP